jgi:protein-L-isoaspartate(D-aspartate) O-methyltransferase
VSLEQARRGFAGELRAVAHVGDDRVVEAFAAVPRERFVGPGPWRALSIYEGRYWTTDSDPSALYHDILIALDEGRGLNTGQPSLWAHHFDRIGVRAGERVLQIGTGSGYFTAILAELVGPVGSVLGLEVDGPLAEAAGRNLAAWPQASVRKVDGVVDMDERFDVVIAFAGVSTPPMAWVDALADGGRALIPLTNEQRFGMLLRVDRAADGFAARPVGNISIFHCVGGRNFADVGPAGKALADYAGRGELKCLRRDAHEADETCWLHGDGWCLSKRELN